MSDTSKTYYDQFTRDNVNTFDEKNRTPLIVAIHTSDFNAVKKIVELGANTNLKSCDVYPLELAVERGNIKIVKYLIKNGANMKKSYKSLAKYNNHDIVYGYLMSLDEDLTFDEELEAATNGSDRLVEKGTTNGEDQTDKRSERPEVSAGEDQTDGEDRTDGEQSESESEYESVDEDDLGHIDYTMNY